MYLRGLDSCSSNWGFNLVVRHIRGKSTAVLTRLVHALLHDLEGALGRLVASLKKALDGLLACRMLLAAHNTPLVLHEVLLVKATTGVLRRAVKNFCLGADSLLVIHSKKALENQILTKQKMCGLRSKKRRPEYFLFG